MGSVVGAGGGGVPYHKGICTDYQNTKVGEKKGRLLFCME